MKGEVEKKLSPRVLEKLKVLLSLFSTPLPFPPARQSLKPMAEIICGAARGANLTG